jgi:hypothetical protein
VVVMEMEEKGCRGAEGGVFKHRTTHLILQRQLLIHHY